MSSRASQAGKWPNTLFVSKRTVDFHLANVYDKLHVNNRVQAFRRATRLGLIPYEAQFAD